MRSSLAGHGHAFDKPSTPYYIRSMSAPQRKARGRFGRLTRDIAGVLSLLVAALASVVALGGGCVGDSGSEPSVPDEPAEQPFFSSVCVAPPRPSAAISLSEVFADLDFERPIALVQADKQAGQSSGRWFLLDQHGLIHSFFEGAGGEIERLQTTDLTDRVNIRAERLDERGLLGIALHPEFPGDPRIFINYTANDGGLVTRVSSLRLDDEGELDPASELVVLQFSQPYTNHNGGQVAFGPDGYLYVGVGDGGDGGDPHQNGQNSNTLLGKILRIDVDQVGEDTAYGIPSDNPYVDGTGLPEIYAIGLRNPWRFSFDRLTGELWVGDVGQNAWEEVSVVDKGGNYGWSTWEGFACFPEGSNCDSSGFTPPVHAYFNPPDDARRSVTGGFVYRGSALPELVGKYVFGDYSTGEIWQLERSSSKRYGAGSSEVSTLMQSGSLISSFAEDQTGELYVLDLGASRVFRIEAGDGAGHSLPQELTDTGCVNRQNPEALAANAVPYEIAQPFWSDGVAKERYIVVPEGKYVSVGDDGDLDVPEGTLLIKNFRHAGKLFETRFFVRHEDGEYSGYSYAHRDDGSAALVEETRVEKVGDLDWIFPGRGTCNQCHTAAAGRSLGLELRQLAIESDGESQLQRLTDAGVFETVPEVVEPYAAIDSSASLEARARAYLHVNCSSCHRPDGPARGGLDLRFDTSLESSGLCEAAEVGRVDTQAGQLLAPGDSSNSVVHARLSRRDEAQMPPLASNLVDEAGAALIAQWIDSLESCP
jgi:uncharacterized repeat protein (TIGR03806 family)